jgi:hypothetical protein
MRKHWYLLVAAAALGCSSENIHYNPTPQLLPQNVRRIALHPIINKTGQFGLEDKLMLAVRDEFLRDGRYPLVPESDSDGVVWTTISRYISTPIQYDSNLVPTAYKLRVLTDLQFVDRRKPDQALWVEKNIDEVFTYAAQTLAGGMSEEQAREQIWTTLAKDIVTRVIDGFGSKTGTSQRVIQGDAPSTAPLASPEEPLTPVNPHAY